MSWHINHTNLVHSYTTRGLLAQSLIRVDDIYSNSNVMFVSTRCINFDSYCLFTGIYAAVVQIPSLNPYRWPGWFLAALALFSAAIVMLFFTEPRPWTCTAKTSLCSCRAGLELSLKLKTKAKTRIIVSFAYIVSDQVSVE